MPDNILERCRTAVNVGTGPISDAMELLGMPRSVITGWHHIAKDPTQAMVGPAYTLRQGAKSPAVPHAENRTRQRDASSELAQAGDIIVIDVNGRTDICTWGENQALMAQSRGIGGLVAHGAVRDSEWIRRMGFPVLCRGLSPVTSRWDLETVAMNEPLTISGVQIIPGDIIYGDADGVIVIPRSRAVEVLDKAMEVHRGEEKRRADSYGPGHGHTS